MRRRVEIVAIQIRREYACTSSDDRRRVVGAVRNWGVSHRADSGRVRRDRHNLPGVRARRGCSTRERARRRVRDGRGRRGEGRDRLCRLVDRDRRSGVCRYVIVIAGRVGTEHAIGTASDDRRGVVRLRQCRCPCHCANVRGRRRDGDRQTGVRTRQRCRDRERAGRRVGGRRRRERGERNRLRIHRK